MAIALPKKITPCPIVEAVVEIRFVPSVPQDAVFGIIYSAFKNNFPGKPEDLPILQMPAALRNSDQNLIYQPHYRLSDDKFLFQIGPQAISFICREEYIGWATFSERIKTYFNKIRDTGIVKTTKRFGLRYINFFEGLNILKKINLSLEMGDKALIEDKIFLNISQKEKEFTANLRLSNESVNMKDGVSRKGSIVDYDIFIEEDGLSIISGFEKTLEDAHLIEKTLFFTLIKKSFLKELSPEY
jgi:uncharacterized protein (TIGR04255 family)